MGSALTKIESCCKDNQISKEVELPESIINTINSKNSSCNDTYHSIKNNQLVKFKTITINGSNLLKLNPMKVQDPRRNSLQSKINFLFLDKLAIERKKTILQDKNTSYISSNNTLIDVTSSPYLNDLVLVDVEEKDVLFLRNNLKKLFCGFVAKEIDQIINDMNNCIVEKDSLILSNHEESNYLYMIKYGTIGYFIENQLVEEYTNGQVFGDYAMHKKSMKRNSINQGNWSYIATSKCSLYLISSEQLQNIQQEKIEIKYKNSLFIVNSLPIIKHTGEPMKKSISDQLQEKKFNNGKFIQNKEEGKFIVFVKSGKLKFSQVRDKTLITDFFTQGQVLNWDLLISSKIAAIKSTIEVVSDYADVILLSLSSLIILFGEGFRQTIMFNCFCQILGSNQGLSILLESKIKKTYVAEGTGESPLRDSSNDVNKQSIAYKAKNSVNNIITNRKRSVVVSKDAFNKIKTNSQNSSQYLNLMHFNTIRDKTTKNIVKECYYKFTLNYYSYNEFIKVKPNDCIFLIEGEVYDHKLKSTIKSGEVISQLVKKISIPMQG